MSAAENWLKEMNEKATHYIPLDGVGGSGRVYQEKVVIQLLEKYYNYDDSIVGKEFFVESPSFEGFAEVLGVNNDDTVRVKSAYTGAIHIVEKDDLSTPEEAELQGAAAEIGAPRANYQQG